MPSNCSGTSTLVVHAKLATEFGIKLGKVPMSFMYIKLHARKNKTL